MTLTTTDPRTGTRTDTDIEETSAEGVAEIVERALAAAADLARRPRAWRAGLLEALADAVDERRADLVDVAASETGLTDARLNGELTRTVFQLRLFGEAVREGSFLEALIDHAAHTPMGPGPDVRRMLVPIGPVAVFGSSNFPFAFSVPGGDTASALAAGNPVIAKAHSAHPLTSRAAYDALVVGAERVGAPHGTIGIVYGQRAGSHLVAHPGVAAVGFTGSLGAATRLREIIDERERPIPFYGELQSVNPLIVTDAALRARSPQIAAGLAASITGSGGQLCTKPGVVFVPAGEAGEAFAADLGARLAAAEPQVLLNERLRDALTRRVDELGALADPVDGAATAADPGFRFQPAAYRAAAADVRAHPDLLEERFGPVVLLLTYGSRDELLDALLCIDGQLTGSIHAEARDADLVALLAVALGERSGRLIFDGFPTGVAVTHGMHHGGPFPATTAPAHTSVGMTAIRRFLRPVAFQNAPEHVLPAELQDANPLGIWRRVDGELTRDALRQ